MGNPNDPFGDMEFDWEKTEKATPGMSAGRLPIHNCYRGVIVPTDPKGDGSLVDHEFLQPEGASKGIKISIEILTPEKIEDETVKGKTHEHVFWITPKNWPYVKRDAETILGFDPKNPKELLDATWAGKTVEFGLKDETYNGFMRSKTTHFNAWSPEKAEGEKKDEKSKAKAEDKSKSTAAKPGTQATKAGTGKKSAQDW